MFSTVRATHTHRATQWSHFYLFTRHTFTRRKIRLAPEYMKWSVYSVHTTFVPLKFDWETIKPTFFYMDSFCMNATYSMSVVWFRFRLHNTFLSTVFTPLTRTRECFRKNKLWWAIESKGEGKGCRKREQESVNKKREKEEERAMRGKKRVKWILPVPVNNSGRGKIKCVETIRFRYVYALTWSASIANDLAMVLAMLGTWPSSDAINSISDIFV